MFDGLHTALWIKFDRVVHDGMVEIGVYTDSLSDVVIPSTLRGLPVTGIGLEAFRFCSISNLIISEGITYIGNGAFESCSYLASVKLPDTLTYLSWWGFANCVSLTNITIPASVNTIVDFAFYGARLSTVYFEGNAPSLTGGNAFAWCPATAYYLPGTTGWADFLSQAGIAGQLWIPQIQTSDGSFGVRNNQFGFNITGPSNSVAVVETCTDLSNPVWTPLQTNTLMGDTLYFSDPSWIDYGNRFYRLHSP